MKRALLLTGHLFVFACISLTFLSCQCESTPFETISPEEAGFSSEKLEAVEERLGQIGSAALLGLYEGKVFISWGYVDKKHLCHSIRKPFLCALYGIYVDRGVIDMNKTLEELGIDDIAPELTASEKQAALVDLIRSRSGVYHPAAAEASVMIETRPERGSKAPGTFFYYNNWDFNVLGTVFEQETSEKIFEPFYREIAQPLGMKDFEVDASCISLQDDSKRYGIVRFALPERRSLGGETDRPGRMDIHQHEISLDLQ